MDFTDSCVEFTVG